MRRIYELATSTSHPTPCALQRRFGDLGEIDYSRLEGHIASMTMQAKKAELLRDSDRSERTVVYRGIKIAPISGKRSATAKAIRDALRTTSEQTRGEPAHA